MVHGSCQSKTLDRQAFSQRAPVTQNTSPTFDQLLRGVAELRVDSDDRFDLPGKGDVVQGKYRIEEKLEAGGMGVVYRATNLQSGGQVALKWILRRSSAASERLVREARAATRIDHPNAVTVFDLGSHRGVPYLVMELLRGRSLRARLNQQRCLAPTELIEIMIPVLYGLRAAHVAGVVHRDLKPDNVYLCEGSDGTPRQPKILDFGIAKRREGSGDHVCLTGDGQRPGTPSYMAPEQFKDSSKVDQRTDLYAAGVLMYEALSGRMPFEADDDRKLERAITTKAPVPLGRIAPHVPEKLQRVVMRAMAKNPKARYPDADALIAALKDCLPATSVALEVCADSTKSIRRPTRLGLAAPLILVVLLWLLGRSAASPNQAPEVAAETAEEPPSPLQLKRAEFGAPPATDPSAGEPASTERESERASPAPDAAADAARKPIKRRSPPEDGASGEGDGPPPRRPARPPAGVILRNEL